MFLYGKRPFSGGMCPGVELALSTMRAGGWAALWLAGRAGGMRGGRPRAPHTVRAGGWVPPERAGGRSVPQHRCLTIAVRAATHQPHARPLLTRPLARPRTLHRRNPAGGKRVVTIPPELGFGDKGLTLRPTEHVPEKQGAVPPGATLKYELELVRVSIPPS